MAIKPADAQPLRRDDAERVRVPIYPLTWQIIGAATLVLGAGVLHFVYAPMHLAAARGQGLFFLLLGFVAGVLNVLRSAGLIAEQHDRTRDG